MVRRPILAISALALTSGCVVGPDYHSPEVAIPASFAGPQPAGAAVDPARWWTLFGDPELDQLIAAALADNPDIAIAASRVRQARLAEITARVRGLPTITADANVSRVDFSRNGGFATLARSFSQGGSGAPGENSEGDETPPPTKGVAAPGSGITTFAIGFDASWELDLFGGVRRGREAAAARADAAVWSARDAAVMLAGEVAQAYFAYRLDGQQTAVIDAEIAARERMVAIVAHRADVGLVPRIEAVAEADALTAARARLQPVLADRALRRHALAILTGRPPAALDTELAGALPALEPIPAIPAGLPSDLLRRRPDIRAAERTLAASTADIGVAVADLYPKFSLTGALQLLSSALGNLFTADSLQTSGTGAVSFPLLDFGKRRAAVESRREDREQAYQRYQATVLGALRDVEDALSQIEAERRRNAALADGVIGEERQVHALDARLRSGFVAQDAVLAERAQLLSAREQLAASDAQLRQSTVALFKAVGGGWDETSPALGAPRPERRSNDNASASRQNSGQWMGSNSIPGSDVRSRD